MICTLKKMRSNFRQNIFYRIVPSSTAVAAVLTTPRVGPISSPFCVTNASEREFPAIDATKRTNPRSKEEEELRSDSVIFYLKHVTRGPHVAR